MSGNLNLDSKVLVNHQHDQHNFKNPILWTDVPDPDVIRVGDVFYMSSTTMHMNPGVPIMKSHDLLHWEIVNYVYDVLSDNEEQTLTNGKHEYGKGSWASCLRYHYGIFYLVVGSLATGKTYIFQTKNIEYGTWERTVLDRYYHDMSLLFDDDGRVYLVYGRGDIKIIELTEDATAVKEDGLDKVIIPNASLVACSTKENVRLLAEGAHIQKINGYYYVFTITWPKNGPRIQQVHRADCIDGVYQGKVAVNDPSGTAQGGIVDTVDGNWYGMLFRDNGSVGRIPCLILVIWNDGWPVFGEQGIIPELMPLPVSGKQSENLIVQSDEFYSDTNTLGLVWQWNHNPDNVHWSLIERPGFLRLKNGRVNKNLEETKNTLTQRTFGPECSGHVAIEISNMKNGDVAGFAAFQKDYGYVAVKIVENSKTIVMVNASSGLAEEIERVPLHQERVYFRIDFDYKNQIDKAYFYYSLDSVNWKEIGNTLQMSYKLDHFMGYRFALFNFATEIPGGYVDFDYFRIEGRMHREEISKTTLFASLGDNQEVIGAPDVSFKVPVKINALPEGDYTSLSTSINIPSCLHVTNVVFNEENITGVTTYSYNNHQLKLIITGEEIHIRSKRSNVVATIHLTVDQLLPVGQTAIIRADFVHVDAEHVKYEVHNAVTQIQVRH